MIDDVAYVFKQCTNKICNRKELHLVVHNGKYNRETGQAEFSIMCLRCKKSVTFNVLKSEWRNTKYGKKESGSDRGKETVNTEDEKSRAERKRSSALWRAISQIIERFKP